MDTKVLISQEETHLISLLRIVATLGVLLVHINQRLPLPGLLGSIAAYGADGVKCFFFLTRYLVMNSWQNRKSTKEYWRKRIARTIPIYYFFVLLLVLFRLDWLLQDSWSIPRALLMLQYWAPPIVSYDYCAMELLGVLAIFMTFYLAIPLLAKWIHSLDGAFVMFCCVIAFRFGLDKAYHGLYDSFCPVDAVTTMSGYFGNAMPYFAAGVLTYFGKQEQRKERLILYLLFIAACGMRYSFLNLEAAGCISFLIAILLCYPPKIWEYSSRWKWIHNIDRVFGMGVYLSQYWCFAAIDKFGGYYPLSNMVRLILMLVLPYCAALVLHYAIENPGAAFVNRIFERFAKQKETI